MHNAKCATNTIAFHTGKASGSSSRDAGERGAPVGLPQISQGSIQPVLFRIHSACFHLWTCAILNQEHPRYSDSSILRGAEDGWGEHCTSTGVVRQIVHSPLRGACQGCDTALCSTVPCYRSAGAHDSRSGFFQMVMCRVVSEAHVPSPDTIPAEVSHNVPRSALFHLPTHHGL